MIVKGSSVESFDFDGLGIFDYTAARDIGCSLAVVEAPPGSRHRKAMSKRSDKYYFVLFGKISFSLDDTENELEKGDLCIVPKGHSFSYANITDTISTLLLVHSPSLDLEAEVFLDDQ